MALLEVSNLDVVFETRQGPARVVGSLNQAMEFQNALRMQGVNSAIAIYPEEGHGIHGYPAVLDFAARTVDWFVQHMPSWHFQKDGS